MIGRRGSLFRLAAAMLLLIGWTGAQAEKLAKDCTNTMSDNCNKSACCNVPGTACYKKNDLWASCRKECIKGPHYDEPQKDNFWECLMLTGGCNPMHKPCGVWEGYKGTPCCEWGCSCNKTKWGMACVPTKESGKYTCNKANEEDGGAAESAGQNFELRDLDVLPPRAAPLVGATAVAAGLAVLAALAAVAAVAFRATPGARALLGLRALLVTQEEGAGAEAASNPEEVLEQAE